MKSDIEENDNVIYVNDGNTTFLELYTLLKANYRYILKILAIFLAIGLFFALGSPTKYSTSSTVMPLINDNTNFASSLLNQFGVADLGIGQPMSTDDISPELYPRILRSTYFMLDIFEHEVFFKKYDRRITLRDYYTNYRNRSLTELAYRYSIGLYGTFKKFLATRKGVGSEEMIDNEMISLSYAEKEYLELLAESINASYEKRTGLIIINVEFDDRIASAELLKYTLDYLTSYITNYKTEKAKIDLKFIEERLMDAEKRFLDSQNALATFQDENLYISSAKFQAEEERLKSEFNIAYNLYNTLTQQQIHASIKVQENTPVFTVIDPIKVPIEKSKPRRIVLMIVFSILGTIAGIIGVIVKQYIKRIKF